MLVWKWEYALCCEKGYENWDLVQASHPKFHRSSILGSLGDPGVVLMRRIWLVEEGKKVSHVGFFWIVIGGEGLGSEVQFGTSHVGMKMGIRSLLWCPKSKEGEFKTSMSEKGYEYWDLVQTSHPKFHRSSILGSLGDPGVVLMRKNWLVEEGKKVGHVGFFWMVIGGEG